MLILLTLVGCFIAPLVLLGAFVWYVTYVAEPTSGALYDDEDLDYSDPELDYRNEYGEV